MLKNKFTATVEKVSRSKIWLEADGRKFYLPVELWPNAAIGGKLELDMAGESSDESLGTMLEEIIN